MEDDKAKIRALIFALETMLATFGHVPDKRGKQGFGGPAVIHARKVLAEIKNDSNDGWLKEDDFVYSKRDERRGTQVAVRYLLNEQYNRHMWQALFTSPSIVYKSPWFETSDEAKKWGEGALTAHAGGTLHYYLAKAAGGIWGMSESQVESVLKERLLVEGVN